MFLKIFLRTHPLSSGLGINNNFKKLDSESDFWRLITDEELSQRHEIAAVLIDGRAYWETLDDFRQVGENLGSSYDSLKAQDRRIMDSHHKLATFALEKSLIIEKDGHWVQNPQLPIPGYTTRAWVDYLMNLYRANQLNNLAMKQFNN